jgi:hypothetical protein
LARGKAASRLAYISLQAAKRADTILAIQLTTAGCRRTTSGGSHRRLAQSLLKGMASSTTVPNFAMGQLRHMPILIPSAETQAEIINRFRDWDLIQEQIDDLREQRETVER